jgi:hypothetical protein
MEKLSPRSYVTGGFDIIKPSLIGFIGKTLRDTGKSWWFDCIFPLADPKNKIKRSGKMEDLYNILDETLCLELIARNRKIFNTILNREEMSLMKRLRDIRNKWAHAPAKGMSENDADNAFQMMIQLLEYIDKNDMDRTVEKLYSIREQIHKYYYDDKPVKASKESLTAFLDEKVLAPPLEDERKTDAVAEVQRKSVHTRELLGKLKTAGEVVNFFWDNIINNPRGLDSHKKYKACGFKTFEDIREEFNQLCYGDEAPAS